MWKHNEYDEEEEPAWGEDDVKEYNKSKVEFQAIPAVLIEKAEKDNEHREKVDVYNDKVLQELKEDKGKVKEQVFHNSGNKNEDLFDQLDSYLNKENKVKEEEHTINPKDFFDNINIVDENNKGEFMNNNPRQMNNQRRNRYPTNNLYYRNNQQMIYLPNPEHVQQQQMKMLYNLQLQQYYIQQRQLQLNAQYQQLNRMMNATMRNPSVNVEEEDDEDDDPLMNDPNPNFSRINPSVFLENPALLVKKNMQQSNWFLMKDNKILGNYTSQELFYLLGKKINEGEQFDNVSISDFQTDLVFQPKSLFDILKEKVPKLIKRFGTVQ